MKKNLFILTLATITSLNASDRHLPAAIAIPPMNVNDPDFNPFDEDLREASFGLEHRTVIKEKYRHPRGKAPNTHNEAKGGTSNVNITLGTPPTHPRQFTASEEEAFLAWKASQQQPTESSLRRRATISGRPNTVKTRTQAWERRTSAGELPFDPKEIERTTTPYRTQTLSPGSQVPSEHRYLTRTPEVPPAYNETKYTQGHDPAPSAPHNVWLQEQHSSSLPTDGISQPPKQKHQRQRSGSDTLAMLMRASSKSEETLPSTLHVEREETLSVALKGIVASLKTTHAGLKKALDQAEKDATLAIEKLIEAHNAELPELGRRWKESESSFIERKGSAHTKQVTKATKEVTAAMSRMKAARKSLSIPNK